MKSCLVVFFLPHYLVQLYGTIWAKKRVGKVVIFGMKGLNRWWTEESVVVLLFASLTNSTCIIGALGLEELAVEFYVRNLILLSRSLIVKSIRRGELQEEFCHKIWKELVPTWSRNHLIVTKTHNKLQYITSARSKYIRNLCYAFMLRWLAYAFMLPMAESELPWCSYQWLSELCN